MLAGQLLEALQQALKRSKGRVDIVWDRHSSEHRIEYQVRRGFRWWPGVWVSGVRAMGME